MKLFSRTDRIREQRMGILSKGLYSGYKRLQIRWANWMSKHTSKFSPGTWKLLLLVFILFTGTCCVYLAVSSFTKPGKNSISITPIRKPGHATQTGDVPKKAAQLSEAEYKRIKKFRSYMDSLQTSPTGRIRYDSIILHRPGLMDSVQFIEMYYEQLKTK